MQGLVVYLIILAIGMALSNASKKKKQNASRPAAQAHPTPAQKPQPGRQPLSRDELKKAVEVLMTQQPATPAQPTVKSKSATVQAKPAAKSRKKASTEGEGFSQGTSFGDEGVDPCHDDMYESRVFASDDTDQAAMPSSVHLQFTPDSVLNGIIMSEVLKRRD